MHVNAGCHLSSDSEALRALKVRTGKPLTTSFGTVTLTSSSSTRFSYDISDGCGSRRSSTSSSR